MQVTASEARFQELEAAGSTATESARMDSEAMVAALQVGRSFVAVATCLGF